MMSVPDGTSIELVHGGFFDYDTPRPEDIKLEDISTALSHTCRFAGHCNRYYSVAEHAVRVSRLVANVAGSDLALAALHHDDHEAYLGDVPTPLKHKWPEYEELAWATDWAICQKLGLHMPDLRDDIVKSADALALRYEAHELKPSKGAGPQWGHDEPLPPPDYWGHLGWDPERARYLYEFQHDWLVRYA